MIVCLGTTPVYQRSMVFERLTPNDVNRAAAVYDYASGKSVNVARVLRTLGEEPLVTGFLGRGERGDALLADLDRAGIRHDFVRVRPPARQCITIIDRAAGTATELVEESQPVDAGDWAELLEKLGGRARAAAACVFSGSLPPGGPEDFYARALRLSAGRHIPRMLDARKGPLRAALKEPAFVVKLNRDELAETVGRALDSDESLLRAMAAATPEHGIVVVTSGSRGAAVLFEGRGWRVMPPTVDARSAVGSGDAFAAGMTVGLLRGQEPHQAAALGAACGAANAMTDLAGHLSAKDVNDLLPKVRVEPL
jgi:tagatose 6-phosphate kinase